MRKIAVVTGTRADYGIYESVLKNIKANSEMQLFLFVVGMHLSPEFGNTVKEIEKDDFQIYVKINILQKSDARDEMAVNVGKTMVRISQKLALLKPDVLLVLGDRGEMLAGAISATYLGIPIAHIHGGEISGNVDEPVRHAITKLSHLHFVATPESANRIIKMGEEPWRIHIVGAPGLDSIQNIAVNEADIVKKYNINLSKPLILVVQHPIVSEAEDAANQMRETLEAIVEFGVPTIIIYPNADAGGRRMIKTIKEYERFDFIKSYHSINHEEYLGLMKIATVMVGNSSSGIIEAPSFNLPVINVGTRQLGRQRGSNVIDVGYNKSEIVHVVQHILLANASRSNELHDSIYSTGDAGRQIVKVLSEVPLDKRLIEKRMTY